MKKSFKAISLIGILMLVMSILIACGGESSSSDDKEANGDGKKAANVKTQTLKLAFNQPENHPQYKAMKEFSDVFKEKTNGAYEIEIFPNELLGAQRETIELLQSGTIAMSIVVGGLMENFNEDFVVFNLPYTFDSAEHQMSVLNNPDIVGDLYQSVKDQGIVVAGAFHSGVRNVYNSKKAVNTPADLAGMKIRVIESDTNIQMMSKMGGTGTPMGQGEVYTAIQSGVLDGGENNELIYSNLKHAEISPYYSFTKHLMFPDYLLINTKIFEDMTEEHRTIFNEELLKAIDSEVAMWEQDVTAAMEAAEEAGAKFNEVNIEAFRSAVQPIIDEKLNSDYKKELFDKVRKAAN